jgi:hypothetical protein
LRPRGQDSQLHANVLAQLALAHQLEQRQRPTVGMAAPGWSRGGGPAMTVLGRAAAASMGGAGASGSKPVAA